MNVISQTFSPVFSYGRKLGFSAKTLNAFFAAHGSASIDGRTVMLLWTDQAGEHREYGRASVGRSKHATEWVNKVNKRTGKLTDET